MDLLQVTARVMTLAQSGRSAEALELGARTLEELEKPDETATPAELAGLWYAVAVGHHVRGEHTEQVQATRRCLELARSVDDPGWMSNALSLQAMALIRANTVEPALLDLAQAEVELAACTDEGLASWAHTGIGYCYLELRLYELAQPHLEAALAIEAAPVPLEEDRVIDLVNLAELHLRWADELERATPYDGSAEEAEEHRAIGHDYAADGLVEAERTGAASHAELCRAMELVSRPVGQAEASLPELWTEWRSREHHAYSGGRATVGGALARALWRSGRTDEALEVAREAADESGDAGDWQVTAGVRWLLVEMECEAGVPGAAAGREYAGLLSHVLWQQRLSTLQGATAALDVERLRGDKLAAQRAAREDPLTGVGNRRALDLALADAEIRSHHDGRPTSLLIIDLDDFKSVNDRHGHVRGDEVLRGSPRRCGAWPAARTSSPGSAATSSSCWPTAPTGRPARRSPTGSRRRSPESGSTRSARSGWPPASGSARRRRPLPWASCSRRPTGRCTAPSAAAAPRAAETAAQASTTTGMIIGRRRCRLDTQRPTTRRIVCWSW
ncbi:GGDEF domain-containing protein [Nocardioides mesophilus]|uniref:GGDEF domain-containing protein n=1 Tax=Nocardioides mesophilus TaxID=433659 RepID=A0A7G9R9F9_9ACTN|nr:GGDEF domain-containing protein [Nocardioides mesophilus]QNN52234.1 GGDEF domain-containing protein [Nocardioides mesophilus]